MGDFNAKVNEKQQFDTMIEPYGFSKKNDHGSRLIDFAEKEHLPVINTCFKRSCRKYAWKSPKGTIIETDYALSNKRWIFTNCSAINRFDIGSDHGLLRTTLRINLQNERRKLMFNRPMLMDYQKLEARQNEFELSLCNCFKLTEQMEGISLSDINKQIMEVLLTSAK